MASPTFVAASTGAVNGATSVNRPSGITTDDVLVAAAVSPFSGDAFFNAPSGWTAIRTKLNSGNYETLRGYYRVVQVGDPSSDTWDIQLNPGVVAIAAFRGADTTTPIQASSDTGSWSSSTTTFTSSDVTATTADTTLVCMFAGNTGSAITYSSIGTLTERANSSNNKHAALFSEAIASSGATGTRSVTSSVSTSFAGFSVLIAPAAGGGGGNVLMGQCCT